MNSSNRRAGAWRSANERLAADERGLGVIEYVVALVLVVAMGVAFWNLFGNDVTCRFADATDAFENPAQRGQQLCIDGAASGAGGSSHAGGKNNGSSRAGGSHSGGSHSGGSRSGGSHSGGSHSGGSHSGANHGSSSSASAASGPSGASAVPVAGNSAPGVPPNAGTASQTAPSQAAPSQTAPSQTSPSASNAQSGNGPDAQEGERSLGSRIGDAIATTGEQVFDFATGAIVGANPLSPAWPVRPKPAFGHEIAYGMGETVASLGGLVYDGAQMLAGGGGMLVSGGALLSTGFAALPVAGPALVLSTGQVVAGSAMATGHMGNFKDGINHMVNGSEPPARPRESGSSGTGEHAPPATEKPPTNAEKPPTNAEKPPTNAEKPPAEHAPGASEKPTAPHEGGSAPGGKPGGKPGSFKPTEPSELGVTVRPDGKEVYYRSMSQKDYNELVKTGKMPATGETSTSPTRAFSEKYDGVLVEFEMKPGTTAELQKIGIRDSSNATASKLPDMPTHEGKWGKDYARFKGEPGQINVQLGSKGGRGITLFNDSIEGFRALPR